MLLCILPPSDFDGEMLDNAPGLDDYIVYSALAKSRAPWKKSDSEEPCVCQLQTCRNEPADKAEWASL